MAWPRPIVELNAIVSSRFASSSARGLERDGLVTRTVFATVPPRVDYELTPLGATLLPPVRALATWAQTHRYAIQQGRARFEASDPRAQAANTRA